VTKYISVVILTVLAVVSLQVQNACSGQLQRSVNLVGLWSNRVPSTNSAGEPCPFTPETLEFYKDQTVAMPEFGSQHLPYKTALTKDERTSAEKRFPALKGKNILLILPNPSMNWYNTPMAYSYAIRKNELTLILQNWSPAKFSRKSS